MTGIATLLSPRFGIRGINVRIHGRAINLRRENYRDTQKAVAFVENYMSQLDQLIEDQRRNAIMAWLITAFLAAAMVESVIDLDLLWAGFTGSVLFLVMLPAMLHGDVRRTVPWELLLVTALPVLGHSLDVATLQHPLISYLSLAGIGIILTANLHLFTPVQLSHRFAIVFVVLTTLAASGWWAVAQWLSDLYRGTGFIQSETALMTGFLTALMAGFLGGILLDLYFRQHPGREGYA